MIHLSNKAFRHQRRGFLGLTDILHYVNAPSRHKCIPREPNPQFLRYRHVLPGATGTMYVSLYLYALLSTVCLYALMHFPGTAGLEIWNVNPCDPLGGFQGPPSNEWIGICISSNQSHQGNIRVSVAAGFELLLSTWHENIPPQIKQ